MNETTSNTPRGQQIALLAASPQEEQEVCTGLMAADMAVARCGTIDDVCQCIANGAAVAIVALDALDPAAITRLNRALHEQGAWSDFPLVYLRPGASPGAKGIATLTEFDVPDRAIVLERPLSATNLVNIVKFAARMRGHQYERRAEQSAHAQTETDLRGAHSQLNARLRFQSETLRLLCDVATASNLAESVEEVLSFTLAQVCRHTGWAFGHAYLPSRTDPEVLVPVDGSYEHAPGRFQALRTATLNSRMEVAVGLPGRVFATGKPEWTRGVDRELDKRRAALAEELGVATVAAFPILAGAQICGVLEFFSDEIADPDPELLEAMTSIGTQLGRVIERDRANRSLRDSIWLTEKISDTAPTMVRLFDIKTQHYAFVNRRMADLLGQPVDQVKQSTLDDFLGRVHVDDVADVQRAKRAVEASRSETPISWQVRVRNAAGEWRWLRTWSVPFATSPEAGADQILSVSIDVTSEVANEERLRQTERLTSIGTLAAGIAHEINNPLASVVMTAQLLRKRRLGQQADEMLTNLIEDARRCGRIVRNVQRFARQEPSERRPLSLNAVVRAAEELCATELRRAGVRTRLTLEEDTPPVDGDATELEQVVVNLITNAAHASPTGQDIAISTRRRAGFVELVVQDEGTGMSAETQRHAFDPFYTTRGREGGTGLGLSIAHGIIEDHGGAIHIDSALGRGTTITIILPAKSPPSDAGSRA